jgi:cobalt-zinc-cadmium efflux system protein
VQLVAASVALSVGLLADAGHNLTDVVALGMSLGSVRLARRPATASRSFGYHRGTILAALANAGLLLTVTSIVVWEAVDRLRHPHPVAGGVVLVVATVATVVNASAALSLRGHGHDLNLRAAMLHVAGDAAASLAVAAAGAVILLSGGSAVWLDAAASLLVAAFIALQALRVVRAAIDVLLESTPSDVDLDRLGATIGAVDGVDSVHDLHVWSLSSSVRALSAHVVLSGHPTLEQAQVVGARVKETIGPPFAIAHSTLELECEPCEDAVDDDCLGPPLHDPSHH